MAEDSMCPGSLWKYFIGNEHGLLFDKVQLYTKKRDALDRGELDLLPVDLKSQLG